MSELYNEEVKNRYLERYDNEGTVNTIRSIFMKTANTERPLGKDLYNFSLTEEELIDVFKELNPLSTTVSASYGRHIKNYLSWAIANGYRDDNINPLSGVDNDWYDQFVDKTRKIHWAEEELYKELIEKLDNAQDQALLSLIFEGILGRGFSELKGILYKHINWNNNEITINRDGEEKAVKVSDRTMRYVENAYKQQVYRIYNEKTGDYNEKELVSSDYLFKNVKSPRTKEGEPLSLQVFYNRMQSIRDQHGLDLLTPNALKQSGINYNVYLLAKEKIEKGEEPEIGYDELAAVGEKYNTSKMTQNGYSYYNTHLIREYCNEQVLKDLYDIDVIMTRR